MKYTLPLLFLVLTIMVQAQSVTPQKLSGTKFAIDCANMHFEIDSAFGARINSFKIGDDELLYASDAGGMYGSTFWPSPQNGTGGWGWPPLPNLDNKPYKSEIKGSKITFTGSTDSKTNLRFYKTMYANAADTSIIIDYCMKNEKASAQSWAPWEVTRVAASGLTIFKKGDGSITGPLYTNLPGRVTQEGGYVWYNQGVSGLTTSGGEKLMSDGVGWLAHIPSTKNRILIKRFENIPLSSAAQGESEVQIYTGQNNSYTELENQGAYVSIPAGDSTTWTVRWYGKGLPFSSSAANVSTGSTKVSNYIEQVVARGDNVYLGINNQVATSADLLVNAAQEYMTVKTNLTSYNNVELLVYDLQGKIALKHSLIDPQQQVSIKGIAAGSYLYQINTGTSSIAKGKFLINP